MTPGAYRRGGAGATITFAIAPTPLGRMLVAATERGLCAVRFGESATELERDLREEFHAANLHRDDAAMERYIQPLLANSARRRISPSICRSTFAPPPFRKESGRRCSQIPRGETRSYTEIARAIGDPHAVRAVARACASNPVAIAVPCHRVVRSDGRSGGLSLGRRAQEKVAGSGAIRLLAHCCRLDDPSALLGVGSLLTAS